MIGDWNDVAEADVAEADLVWDEDKRPWIRVRSHIVEAHTVYAGVQCDGCGELRYQHGWTIVHVNPPVPLRIAFWFCCEECTQAFVVARSIEYG